MLAGAGLFVYLRLRADLDDTVNTTLSQRVTAVVQRQAAAGPPRVRGAIIEDREEGFVQMVGSDGRVLDAIGGAHGPALSPGETRRAAERKVIVERHVPGIEGPVRVLARSTTSRSGPVVVVAGQSLVDRNEALNGVITSFAFGGAIAILLASGIGYLLASAGLAPVEAMRRRAREVSLKRADERLPLPAARDEVRRLGETLNEMLDRLRQSFERERRFVSDASHELRTPIAIVKTEIEGALRTGDYGEEVREALVAAVEECDRLAQLAEDLLVIARASEGELPVRSEAIQIRPLLEGIRMRFIERAQGQNRTIRVDASDDQRLTADPLRLRQALANLVDNALRYGAGDVVLSSRTTPAGVELLVADGGKGFPPDIAARAFDRFARGDHGRGGGGAGLGLAIVRAVAHAHGGEATIVDGRRTAVRIVLPNRPAAPAGGLSLSAEAREPDDEDGRQTDALRLPRR
jgi:signal transduction histidine kinase